MYQGSQESLRCVRKICRNQQTSTESLESLFFSIILSFTYADPKQAINIFTLYGVSFFSYFFRGFLNENNHQSSSFAPSVWYYAELYPPVPVWFVMIQPWPDPDCSPQAIRLASSLLPFTLPEYWSHYENLLINLKKSVLACQALKGVGHSHQPSKLLFYALYLNPVVQTTRIKIYFYVTMRWCIGGPFEWPQSPCIDGCFSNIWIDFPVELPRTNLADSLALQAWAEKGL